MGEDAGAGRRVSLLLDLLDVLLHGRLRDRQQVGNLLIGETPHEMLEHFLFSRRETVLLSGLFRKGSVLSADFFQENEDERLWVPVVIGQAKGTEEHGPILVTGQALDLELLHILGVSPVHEARLDFRANLHQRRGESAIDRLAILFPADAANKLPGLVVHVDQLHRWREYQDTRSHALTSNFFSLVVRLGGRKQGPLLVHGRSGVQIAFSPYLFLTQFASIIPRLARLYVLTFQ